MEIIIEKPKQPTELQKFFMSEPDQIDMMSEQELRLELRRVTAGAAAISAAYDRSLDVEKTESCKWLVELPMTDAEMQAFKAAFILSNVPDDRSPLAFGTQGCSAADVPKVPQAW